MVVVPVTTLLVPPHVVLLMPPACTLLKVMSILPLESRSIEQPAGSEDLESTVLVVVVVLGSSFATAWKHSGAV